MSVPSSPPDLLDLKMLPAWAAEASQPNDYSNFEGEDENAPPRRERGPQRARERGPRDRNSPGRGPKREGGGRRPERRDARRDGPREERPRPEPMALPAVNVHFIPHAGALENVAAQIKSGTVAYSVFALARMFLDKPERYDVRLTVAAESELFRLGEAGEVAADRRVLEAGAFAGMQEEFYAVETTQSEPIKGNFTNVARDRLSGTLLGPTNHHSYQPQLRGLYEKRFSRRMSFPDFQRQIEISSDPAVVEQWKEQARSVTTFTAKNTEPPQTFASAAEAERHFRQEHLPNLVQSATELTIDGVLSRRLRDRGLSRVIEDAWSHEIRSPSKMMQELAGALRQAGLNIFRHRRGMLFVSPIRVRPFAHERDSVSASVNRVLEKVGATPGINRKQLADEIAPAAGDAAEVERAKMTLASDLRWLVSEGFVIEFNDGSLDLPRVKAAPESKPAAAPEENSPGNTETKSETPALEKTAAELPLAEPDQPSTTSSVALDSAPSS